MTKEDLSHEGRRAVLDCQNRFWLALQRQDAELFKEVLAEDFVCRSPGQEDQDRSAFIATLTSLPVTIFHLKGEAIAVHFVNDLAILTGTQLAQMRLPDGKTVSQQIALTNVFQHRGGLWQMIFAHPVELGGEA
jgi:hypothetical protein